MLITFLALIKRDYCLVSTYSRTVWRYSKGFFVPHQDEIPYAIIANHHF